MGAVASLLQLVFGFAVVLAPGALLARTVGVRGASATLAWALALVFAALAVTFVVHGSLTLTLVLLLGAGVVALIVGVRRGRPQELVSSRHELPGRGAALGAGVLLGLLLWHVAGNVGGDGFFHLARIQKLLAFGDLSLRSANEFPDGGLHPGYAFPLWHGLLALVAKVSGADPVDVVLHGPTVLAPLAVLVAYEAGWALFRRAVPAATSAAAGVALVAMAPGHAGALTALALPATASRQLLVPAALALALEAVRRPTPAVLASAAAASLALVAVHPTYALFLWFPFAGFVVVRWLWERRDARAGSLALAALVVPAAAFVAWLLPVVGDTASVDPDAGERTRGFDQYAGQLHGTADRFSVLPELFGRTGGIAVAALLLLPLAGLAARRRWAAYVVGGSLAVFVVCLVPWIFTPFSDAVSLSQSRRLAGFLPLAFALAGGIGVLARLVGRAVVPLALAVGIVFQLVYPGDFGYTLENGGPAWATWVAVVGAVVALGLGFRHRPPLERTAALASALVLLPTYVHGLTHWSPSEARRPSPLPSGLDRRGSRRRPRRRDRVLVSRGELPPRRDRADPRVRRLARARRRHGRESPPGARARVPALRAHRRPRRSRAPAAPPGSSSTASASRSSRPRCPLPTATSGGCCTGSDLPGPMSGLDSARPLSRAHAGSAASFQRMPRRRRSGVPS